MKAEDRVKSLEETITAAVAKLEFLRDVLDLARQERRNKGTTAKLFEAVTMAHQGVDFVIDHLNADL